MKLNKVTKRAINESDINTENSHLGIVGSRMTVIEIESGSIAVQFDEINDLYVKDVAITNKGRTVIAYYDYIRYYDETGNLLRDLNSWMVESIAISPVDNNILAVGREDGIIEMWNLETGERTNTWKAHEGHISVLEFNQGDGSRLMSASPRTSKVQVWNPITGERNGPEHKYYILCEPSISFDGTRLAFALERNQKQTISVVDIDTGHPVTQKIPNPYGFLLNLVFEPSGKEIISSYLSAPVLGCRVAGEYQIETFRWSLDNGHHIGDTFEGQVESGIKTELSASNITNNLLISTSSESSVVLIWERTTARIKNHIKLEPDTKANYTRVSPDGQYFLMTTEIFTPDHLIITKPQILSSLKKGSACADNFIRAKSSNLADVTNTIIASSTYPAPVCAGISEFNIADGIGLGLQSKLWARYTIPNQPNLFFGVTPSNQNLITVSIEPQQKNILIEVPLFVDVYHLQELVSTHRISRTRVTFTIKAKPQMVTARTDVAQRFQLDLDGTHLDTEINPFIIDPTTVLGTFGSEEAFVQLVEKTVKSMLTASEKGVSLYLSSLVVDAPMPDAWNRAREYELIFNGFDFQHVTVQTSSGTENLGYIFFVCSLVSYNFPPPCICREDTVSLGPNIRQDIHDPRRWISLAFSEAALIELANPHRNSGDRTHKEKGGTLYASVDNYHKSEIGTILINDDNISADVSVGGGGSLSVGLRDPVFRSKVLRESVGYDLSITDVETIWDLSILSDFTKKGVTSVVLHPTVIINPDNIHFDLITPLPRELNQIMSWIGDVFLKILVTTVSAAIIRVGYMEMIYDIFNNDEQRDFSLLDARGKYYSRSSIVVIAEATACKLES